MTPPNLSAVRAEPVEARAPGAAPAARPSTSLGTNGAAGIPSPDQQQLRKVAEQFEAVMLRQMIGSMRSASLADGMFDTSATQQFRDMSDAKTADAMAKQGALGIADLLVKQYGARLATPAATAKTEPAK